MSPVEKVADRLNAKPFGFGNVLHLLTICTAADKVSGHFARHFGQPVTVFSASAQAALSDFVRSIVSGRSKPQVIRIHAGGSVALVQYMKRANRSFMLTVRKAMGKDGSVAAGLHENAVPSMVYACRPQPTSAHRVMVNVAHKSVHMVHRLTVSTHTASVK